MIWKNNTDVTYTDYALMSIRGGVLCRALSESKPKAPNGLVLHMLIEERLCGKQVCGMDYDRRMERNRNSGQDMRIEDQYLDQALRLHAQYPVVDMHLDLAGEILLRHELGEQNVLYHHYLENFHKAGIRILASSIYVANCDLDHAWANAQMQIALIKGEIVTCNLELQRKQEARMYAGVRLIRSRKDLQKVLEGKELGILLYMEGLDCIGEDLDKLEELYVQGIRGAALTWSRPDALAVGCCKASEHRQIPGGLTKKGVAAVQKLEELSMFLDVSHLNDDGYEDVCRIAERPFVATHSNSRTVYDNYRNLTDRQMRVLAEQGGVMGLNGCRYITGSLQGDHLAKMCEHIEYEIARMGSAHVGFGFDLCDSYDEARAKLQAGNSSLQKDDCLPDHAHIPMVTAALLQRGMKEQDVIQIMGKSWILYLKEVLP